MSGAIDLVGLATEKKTLWHVSGLLTDTPIMKTLDQLKRELSQIAVEIETYYPGQLKIEKLDADTSGAHTDELAIEDLSLSIDYSSEALQSKAIFSSPNYKAILLALEAEQALKTHTTPVEAMLVVLEGFVSFTMYDKEHKFFAGNVIKIPANIKHSLKAIINSKLLLVK
jgi:quercetin dioxygenase-like cupin family protein